MTTVLTTESFKTLRDSIYVHSGIVIESGKQYLLESRLRPVAARLGLASLNELCALLRRSPTPALIQEMVEAMTTHETSFFRDPQQFELLRSSLVPALLEARKTSRRLTFWSAAASGGQEAYSLAMTLLPLQPAGWQFEILATDLSERILTRARAGRYNEHETSRGLSPTKRNLYFRKSGTEYLICEEAKRLVQFRRFDLRSNVRTLGKFDVVMCRNVMIYFDTPTRQKLFGDLAAVTSSDGAIFLGSTETTLGITDRLERRSLNGAVYYVPLSPRSAVLRAG